MRLFVNYAEEDKWQLKDLVKIFQEASYESWFDILLLPGQDKTIVLTERISNCDAFVYLLSRESVASDWCKWAFAKAVHAKRPIVPILIRANTSIPESLQSLQYANFTEGIENTNVARLIAGINQSMIISPDKVPLIDEPMGKPAQLAPIVYAGFIQEDKSEALRAINDIQKHLKNISILPLEDMTWDDKEMLAAIVFLSEASRAVARMQLQQLVADNKKIIPIILSGTREKAVPSNLAGASNYDLQTDRANSISAVVVALGNLVVQQESKHRGSLEDRYWNTIVKRLEKESCIPIIGPDMCGDLFPSEQMIVKDWINQYEYAVSDEPELARVAQYLAYVEFSDKREIKSRLIEQRELNGKSEFIKNKDNPYRILARLPIRVFLTTGHDNFLYKALLAEGKNPKEIKEWSIPDIKSEEEDFATFTVQAPAVVYLLGHYQDEGSLTILEDDFMEFIYRFGKQELRFPTSLEKLLENNLLLLMGFRIHDWSFRVTAQMLTGYLNQAHDIRHVAVQVTPLKNGSSDAQRDKVEKYVKAYLNSRNSEVHISDTASFLDDLQQRWEARSS